MSRRDDAHHVCRWCDKPIAPAAKLAPVHTAAGWMHAACYWTHALKVRDEYRAAIAEGRHVPAVYVPPLTQEAFR